MLFIWHPDFMIPCKGVTVTDVRKLERRRWRELHGRGALLAEAFRRPQVAYCLRVGAADGTNVTRTTISHRTAINTDPTPT